MKGLILKDLLLIKSNTKTLAIVLLCFIILSMNDMTSIAFILPFFSVLLCITTFSYDDYNKWDGYAISLPTGRKDAVKSKYIATIALVIISSLISLVVVLIMSKVKTTIDFDESLSTLVGGLLGIVLVMSIMYPLIYKYGSEKGRLIILVLVIAFSTLISFLSGDNNIHFFNNILDFLDKYGLYIIPVVSIIILYISYSISNKVYMKKEF